MVLSSHDAFSTIDLLWFAASECLSLDAMSYSCWFVSDLLFSPLPWITFFPSPSAFSPPFIPRFLPRSSKRLFPKKTSHPSVLVSRIFAYLHANFFVELFFFFLNFIRTIKIQSNKRQFVYRNVIFFFLLKR